MNRNRIIIALVALLVVAGLGAVLYNRVLGESQAASGPITAIPLTAEASTAARPASEPADPAATVPEPAAASTPAPDAPAPGGLLRYRIVPEESQVRFTLSEVLRGQPTEVVGVSNQVAGELAVDPDDLSTAQVGVIQVNARTLETDNAQRNRAIRRFILETDTHEFITFTPTAIEGLSGSGGLGQPFTFT
ncbi:MAG TPA: YceI family protein, partial [Roseiflexaceae bacterium]|nr:YceI family protein [Roseiflexaceae bacterium]